MFGNPLSSRKYPTKQAVLDLLQKMSVGGELPFNFSNFNSDPEENVDIINENGIFSKKIISNIMSHISI